MASVEEQVSALYQRQYAAAEAPGAAPDRPPGRSRAGRRRRRRCGRDAAHRAAAAVCAAALDRRRRAPRRITATLSTWTLADSEDRSDPPTPPGDDGYSSSSSDCSVESIGGQYVPQPPGPASESHLGHSQRRGSTSRENSRRGWRETRPSPGRPIARRGRLPLAGPSMLRHRRADYARGIIAMVRTGAPAIYGRRHSVRHS